MERGPIVGCSEKDVWIQDKLNTTVCLWILFYPYFDYIFILSGLDKNLNKTSKIKADLRIVKVVNFKKRADKTSGHLRI